MSNFVWLTGCLILWGIHAARQRAALGALFDTRKKIFAVHLWRACRPVYVGYDKCERYKLPACSLNHEWLVGLSGYMAGDGPTYERMISWVMEYEFLIRCQDDLASAVNLQVGEGRAEIFNEKIHEILKARFF